MIERAQGGGGLLPVRLSDAAHRRATGPKRLLVAGLVSAWSLAAPAHDAAAQQDRSVRGRVVDGVSGNPVSGADVSWNEVHARVSTDAEGRFRISNLPLGARRLGVTRLGYEDRTLEAVDPADPAELEIILVPAAIALSALTVSPGAFSFGGRTPSARQTMSRAEIDAVPQFAEDIFRAVNRLPGLSSGDFTSRFSVRGGRPEETLDPHRWARDLRALPSEGLQ